MLQAPDSGAGEGIHTEPLPHAAPTHRAVTLPVADGTTDQNLVPEPTHESQERKANNRRNEQRRATKARRGVRRRADTSGRTRQATDDVKSTTLIIVHRAVKVTSI